MIAVQQLVKRFGEKAALDGISLQVETGSVFGLVGSNGAGKSTLLRTLAGVYRPDGGQIRVDGVSPHENSEVKGRIFFVPDYPYFLPKASLEEMALLYRRTYLRWNQERYGELCRIFALDAKGRLHNFSKGMQRQAALVLALSCQPDLLLLDEGGYVMAGEDCKASLPGVFAAGDCTGLPLQVSKAVGEGQVAGHRASEYVDTL